MHAQVSTIDSPAAMAHVIAMFMATHAELQPSELRMLESLDAFRSIGISEEEFLRGKFGQEFEDYCRRVPRFGFRLRGLRETLAGSTFDWRRVVAKEYGSTFSGTSFVLFLFVWDRWLVDGWPAARGTLLVALAIWAPCIVLYLVARRLKKTSRLGTAHAETPATV